MGGLDLAWWLKFFSSCLAAMLRERHQVGLGPNFARADTAPRTVVSQWGSGRIGVEKRTGKFTQESFW